MNKPEVCDRTATLVLFRSDDPFARIPKTLLSDRKLTWKAKGILCYLLGKPNGWKVRVSDIANQSDGGPTAVRTGLAELRACGYVSLVQERTSGRISGWKWKVSDSPCFSATCDDPPDVDNQHVEDQHNETRYVSKNDSSKNECTKNGQSQVNSTGTVPIVPFPDADASGALSLNLLESSGELKASESEKENVAKKEKSPRTVLSDAWMAAYLAVFGRTYPFDDSADGKGLTLLLALKMPVAEIIGIAKDAWQHARTKGDRFNFSRSSPSLLRFAQSFNLIAAEVRPAQVDYSEGFR
jgi:hypothetical protein